MTDIVERARNRNMPFGHLELIDKLADEIERLTAQNTMIFNDAAALTQAIDALAQENERLRADLATYSKDTEATENRIIDAEFAAQEWQAEVERLKADMAGDQQRLFHCEAEIKQLRELTYGGYKEGKP